jgi:multiple sugar transport system permease protein
MAGPKAAHRSNILTCVILGLGSIVMVFPMVWMLVSSLKTITEITHAPPVFFPERPMWSNYAKVASAIPYGRMYINSLVITAVATTSTLFFSALGGYTFGKMEFPGRNALLVFVVATMLVPFSIIVVPLYLLVAGIGLVNTYLGIVLPSLMSAFGIYMVRQFCASIPNELLDVSRIDGCREFTIFLRIILPLLGPCLGALAIFTFMWDWNAFLWPMLMANSQQRMTIPVGLAMLVGEFSSESNLIMAGASLAIVPVLIVFLFAQRQIIEGITLTGLKA